MQVISLSLSLSFLLSLLSLLSPLSLFLCFSLFLVFLISSPLSLSSLSLSCARLFFLSMSENVNAPHIRMHSVPREPAHQGPQRVPREPAYQGPPHVPCEPAPECEGGLGGLTPWAMMCLVAVRLFVLQILADL